MLLDELAHVCRSAFGQAEFSVEVEPWVRRQAGGGLADLRADVGVRGLDQPGTMTMLDVRICHPAADSHIRLGTDTVLSNAQWKKQRCTVTPAGRGACSSSHSWYLRMA